MAASAIEDDASLARAPGRAALIASLALAGLACAGETPSGRTSVYLTVENSAGAVAPDELRLDATGDEGIVFAEQRIPMSGLLLAPGGATLGTITLYVKDGTGALQVEVRGYLGQDLRSRGTTIARVVAGRQVTARVVLAEVSADGGRDQETGNGAEGGSEGGLDAAPDVVAIPDAPRDGPAVLPGTGGTGAGGATSTGGAIGVGGTTGTGGAIGTGGRPGTGGATGVGGAIGVGGATGTGGAVADASADRTPADGPGCAARFNFEGGTIHGTFINTAYQTAFTTVASSTDAYCGAGSLRVDTALTATSDKGELIIPFAQAENLGGKTFSITMKSAPASSSTAFIVVFLIPSYAIVTSYTPFLATWTTKTVTLPSGTDAGTGMATGISIQAIGKGNTYTGAFFVDEIDIR